MRFDELLNSLKDRFDDGRWIAPFAITVVAVTVGVFMLVAWPSIKPRPTGQYMPLSSVVTTTTQDSAPQPATVPSDVKDSIIQTLNVDDPNLVSVSWFDAEQTKVMVRVSKGGNEFDSYEFKKTEQGWERQ